MEAHGVYIKLMLDLEPGVVREKLANEYNIHPTEVINQDAFVRSYDISQYSSAPVLRQRAPKDPTSVLHVMRWGLLPGFKEHEGVSYPLMWTFDNCTSGMWIPLFADKRCVVVCQGIFLWRTKKVQEGKKKKNILVPYYHKYSDDRLILLAAVYDHNEKVLAGPIDSFSLLVSRPKDNNVTPAVLQSADAVARWLDTGAVSWPAAKPLALAAIPANLRTLFTRREVAPDIERAGAEGPALLRPPAERSDGIMAGLARSAQQAHTPPDPARRALKPRSAPVKSTAPPTPASPPKSPAPPAPAPPSPPKRKRGTAVPSEVCGSAPRKKVKVAYAPSARLQDALLATEKRNRLAALPPKAGGSGGDKTAEGTSTRAAGAGKRKRAPSSAHEGREDGAAAGSSPEGKKRPRTTPFDASTGAAAAGGKGKGRADGHESGGSGWRV
ncbi:SOS response associated peptidase SARP domain-containing protein [Phanerochaete sordida]|uniref:SOS response associated peptidase SARP domain-containing protein n=1 Tax=Phanerochaete sordida TaxID=48140 RepID=A0A9P3GGZ3_9APHY|nr:SOS response associated peptidase SARP domain-containing protein [Phanerochaete sordida]